MSRARAPAKGISPRKKRRKKLREFFAEEIHGFGIDIEDFGIYLTGTPIEYADLSELEEPGVEYQMATQFIKNLQILSRLNPRKIILIHMKTCGGGWEEGMAIYDAICACPNPVVILSYTHARSMSSLILQAADKRALMPNSSFLFHEGDMTTSGTQKQVFTDVEWTKKIMPPTMLGIYTKRLKEKGKFSRWSVERIREMLQEEMDKKTDVYLTAREAVEWGFADEVFGSKGMFNWNALRRIRKS